LNSPDRSKDNAGVGEQAALTAEVLNEALPYIQRFSGRTIVIKYGGNAMTDERLQHSFARNIVLMKQVGLNPIVVHGGGPQIGQMLNRIGKESQFIDGMRVTDHETMEIVEMVLGGQVNKNIVSLLSQAGGQAIGLTGKDGELMRADPLIPDNSGSQPTPDNLPSPLGFVGTIKQVDTTVLDALIRSDFIPVIAPIAVGSDGHSYNINADLAASSIAGAMQATRLLLLTNTPGILDKNDKLLTGLGFSQLRNGSDRKRCQSGADYRWSCRSCCVA